MSDESGATDAEEALDWIARAGRRAKGRRPDFFDDFATDRLLSIVVALVGEVSVLRQRLDTVELLLERNGGLDRADIEDFRPDRAQAERRATETRAYVARVMRGVQQAMEAIEAGDEPPVAEISRRLRES